jgi:hypothetical protein
MPGSLEGMKRSRLSLLAPVIAAGSTRVLQLVLLAVLLTLAEGSAQATLVAGFALLSSFAILTDSGATNYLLSLTRDRLGRPVHLRATAVHIVLATAGATAAVVITLNSGGAERGTGVIVVMAGLAVSQVFDSVTRTTRAPQLVLGRDGSYALPDIALVISKAPVLVAALLLDRVEVLAIVAIPSTAIAAYTFFANRRAIAGSVEAPPRMLRTIAQFGLSGSLSALYSQAPLVLGTIILGVGPIAPLALAYRVVQPLEVVPATVSQQLIPRVRNLKHSFVRYWAVFLLTGLVFTGLLALFLPLISELVGDDAFDPTVFLIIALSVGPKFGNYALVAFSMGRGYISQRLTATIVIGVIAVTLTLVFSVALGNTALASVTLISEGLLAVVLSLLIRARMKKEHLA